jgi:transposase-like protein
MRMPRIRKRFSAERNENVTSYYTKVANRLEDVTQMRLEKFSMTQIAHELGVSNTSFLKWSKKYQDLANALAEGNASFEQKAEESLFKSAFGYYYTEEKETLYKDPEGNTYKSTVEKHKRWKQANPMLLMNMLKSLNADKWASLEESNKDIQIELDKDLEEYAE